MKHGEAPRRAGLIWVVIGAVSAALAVAAGAFGAHALSSVVTAARLATWDTAASYHLVHSVALCLAGALAGMYDGAWVRRAALLFCFGLVFFAGSLYALVLLDAPFLGAITPLGGIAFIAGWLSLAYAAWTNAKADPGSA